MIHLLIALALATPVPAPPQVLDVVDRWEWVGLDVSIKAESCGYENAWYQPSKKQITLCTELFRDPDLAAFVLSHELAHAFMWQMDVPQRRGEHDQERVADEMAFLFSTRDEVTAAARWFIRMGDRDDSEDEHPSPRKRAGALLCLDMGRAAEDELCERMYDSMLAHWVRIFDGYWTEPALP